MSNILPNDLADLGVSLDLVLECIGHLKPGKSDGTSLSSDCLFLLLMLLLILSPNFSQQFSDMVMFQLHFGTAL